MLHWQRWEISCENMKFESFYHERLTEGGAVRVTQASWPCPTGTCLRERKFLTPVIESWEYKWRFSMKDQHIYLFLWKVTDVWPAYHFYAGKSPGRETSQNNELPLGFQLTAVSCMIFVFCSALGPRRRRKDLCPFSTCHGWNQQK
jgi:hypothetical protein